jgi:hypothetical protein
MSYISMLRLYLLYFVLVRPKLEYIFAVWKYITSVDAMNIESIQRKYPTLLLNRVFAHIHYNFAFCGN